MIELHSLSKNINANSIRFWMGFSDHYINVFNVLRNIGLLSEKTVRTAEGVKSSRLKSSKLFYPIPCLWRRTYTGYTCIGNLTKGKKNGEYKESLSTTTAIMPPASRSGVQAISYTAGVPPVAAAILVAKGIWNPKRWLTWKSWTRNRS